MDYSTDFPKLPDAQPAAVMAAAPIKKTAWSRPVIDPSTVTQAVAAAAAANERANSSEVARQFKLTAYETGANIELSESKDGALTVVIKGLRAKAEETKAKVVRELQTQANREIDIPKEYHGKLIGRGGELLRQLEAECNCRIHVPNRDEASNAIRITGPKEGIDKATAKIRAIAEKEFRRATENVFCPRAFYPWVRGPYNENVDRLTARFNIEIHIPPTTSQNEIIVISGKREGVHRAAAEIKAIVANKQATAKETHLTVPRAQHRHVIGQLYSGINEILKETGVAVEMPPEESDSDIVTLRGDMAQFARATQMVFTRAFSTLTMQINAPNWLHRFIIGFKGTTLQKLVGKSDRLKIDFLESAQIRLEGPPAEVQGAAEILKNEVERLKKEIVVEKIKVDPSLRGHVIGKGGSFITKITEETGVKITIPDKDSNSDEITFKGKRDGVQKAVIEIRRIVSKIENEKSRDIIIPQRLHKNIIGSKSAEINKLKEAHPKVVTVRGPAADVDKAVSYLTALAQNKEINVYEDTVSAQAKHHKFLVGKGSARANKFKEQHDARIMFSKQEDADKETIHLLGRKDQVLQLKKELESSTKQLNEPIEIELEIEQEYHGYFVQRGGALINEIQEQNGDVQISFPPRDSGNIVSIKGLKRYVESATARIGEIVGRLECLPVEIPIEHIRSLVSNRCQKINDIQAKYGVHIQFARKGGNLLYVTGRGTKCEAARKALLERPTRLCLSSAGSRRNFCSSCGSCSVQRSSLAAEQCRFSRDKPCGCYATSAEPSTTVPQTRPGTAAGAWGRRY